MLKMKIITVLVCLIITGYSTNTFSQSSNNHVSSEILLQKSGFNFILQRTPLLIQEKIDKLDNDQLTEETRLALSQQMLKVLHPSLLRQDISAQIDSAFSEGEQQALINFFQSPAYQEIQQLKQYALHPEQKEQLLRYHDKLHNESVNSYRKQLISDIDKTWHQSDIEASLQSITTSTLVTLLDQTGAEATLLDAMSESGAKLSEIQSIEETVLFYAFRKTPNSTLESYVRLLNQPLNQRFFSFLTTSLEYSIYLRIKTLAESAE